MDWRGRIVSEANAFGKAKGYADGDTAIGKVELPVAMYSQVVTHDLKYLNDKQQQAQAENTFAKAKGIAKQASDLAQNAKSPEKWKGVAVLWQKATKQMLKVPSTATKYKTARSKADEYAQNRSYMQLKVKQKLKVTNLHYARK